VVVLASGDLYEFHIVFLWSYLDIVNFSTVLCGKHIPRAFNFDCITANAVVADKIIDIAYLYGVWEESHDPVKENRKTQLG
jgi:hypothetical protein